MERILITEEEGITLTPIMKETIDKINEIIDRLNGDVF